MKKLIPFFHLFIGYLFLFCYQLLYNDNSFTVVYQTHNIFTIPIYCFLCYILFQGWRVYPSFHKNKWIFPVLGSLYGTFLVFGTNILRYDYVPLVSPFTWISVFSFSYVITGALLFFYHYILPWLRHLLLEKEYPILEKIYKKINFLPIWGAIFVCWLPVFLACYPGIASYDANFQLSQVEETLNLTAHHPVVHTLFLGGLVQLGRVFLGSANGGMFLYTFLQMLINSCIFAYGIHVLKRNNVKPVLCIICFAFYAFMPFNSLFAICATKDSIFSSLFLLLMIILSEMTLNDSVFFKHKKNMVSLVLTLFCLLIFRNNMLYALVVSLPFLILSYQKYKKQVICFCIIPVFLLQLFQGILHPALNVVPGNSREAYSVIMQQFANVYNNCELETNEKELLLGLMDDDCWKKYEPRKSDSIKNHFKTGVFQNNFIDYFKLWIKLGIQFPTYYLNAFFNLTYAYWYPNDVLPDDTTYRKYIEIYDTGDITFDSKFPWLFAKLKNLGMNATYQKLPVISTMFTPAFYIWILLFLFAINFYHRKWEFIKLLILPATLFLTLLLGPVALLRYLYPLVLCVPYLISINTKM